MEVKNDLGEVYVVVLTSDYYPDVIIKDSLEGEWIFAAIEWGIIACISIGKIVRAGMIEGDYCGYTTLLEVEE